MSWDACSKSGKSERAGETGLVGTFRYGLTGQQSLAGISGGKCMREVLPTSKVAPSLFAKSAGQARPCPGTCDVMSLLVAQAKKTYATGCSTTWPPCSTHTGRAYVPGPGPRSQATLRWSITRDLPSPGPRLRTRIPQPAHEAERLSRNLDTKQVPSCTGRRLFTTNVVHVTGRLAGWPDSG